MTHLAHLHIQAENGPLSNECVDRGIISFQSLIEWVEQLPYGRNTDRSNYNLVLAEEKGTCSTKNAIVKAVAIENHWDQVQLFLGLFFMSEKTHTGIGSVLDLYQLKHIPEAHTYLKINGSIKDVTGLKTGPQPFDRSLQSEVEVLPDQIGNFKVDWHRDYLREFQEQFSLSADELWKIHEECISFFSNTHDA